MLSTPKPFLWYNVSLTNSRLEWSQHHYKLVVSGVPVDVKDHGRIMSDRKFMW